jgi:hypothetical protein
MGRIPVSAREDVSEAELEAYDTIMARVKARGQATPSQYNAAMLRSPLLGAAVNQLGRAVRVAPLNSDTYTHVDFELVVHALGVDAGFLEHHHITDALAQGVSADALQAILEGRDAGLGDEESCVVQFARGVVHDRMTDTLWEAVCTLRGTRAAVDLSILAGFVWATLRWQHAWGVAGITVDEAHALLRSHREGTLELPDKQTAVRAG